MFNKGKRERISIFIMFSLMFMLVSAPVSAAKQKSDDRLAEVLQSYVACLKENPLSEGMTAGYEVYSLEDHKSVASFNKEKTFVPASVFKLLVTAAAVGLLPEDFSIPTKVFLDGKVNHSGVLNGNIVLKGFGDPTLSVEKLDSLAQSLADQGIHKINGNLIVDESYLDDQRLGKNWMWDDEQYDYNTQMSALSVKENTVDVTVQPTEIGMEPNVSIDPAPGYLHIVNHAKTVEGSGRDLSITRTRAKNEIVISGSIGKDYSQSGYKVTRTIVDPATFTGTVFQDLLLKEGVTFQPSSKIMKGKASKHAKQAAVVQSPELDEMLTYMDKESDNFYAEMLTKQLGALKGEQGSTTAGIKVIDHYVEKKLHVDEDFIQEDGSGLTRLDHISPHAYTQLLSGMYNSPQADRFISFLPIAGVDGTLKNRMKGTPAEGNVKAKTGSMSGVNSLVGYVKASDGEMYVVSILSNGIYKSAYARGLQDEIAETVAGYPGLPELEKKTIPENTYPLSGRFDPILDEDAYKGIIKGAVIYSTKQNKVLYERNPKALLTPGASVKLLTGATALEKLGENYQFKTELYTNGTHQNGTLKGDLIVKGYGDPTITTDGSNPEGKGPALKQMAEDIKKAGINRIQGNIIVDSSFFSDDVYAPGWTWDHESEAYQPQITALSVDRGAIRVGYEPGAVGKGIHVSISPAVPQIKIINKATTGKLHSKNTLTIERDRGENTIRISGNLPAEFKKGHKDVAIEQPALNAGYALSVQLAKAGVHLSPGTEVVKAEVPASAKLLHTYQSSPLSEIVDSMNHANDNFTAEMIVRTLGAANEGKGTFDGGIQMVHQYMEDMKIPSNFDMADGSGLSRYTQISAEAIVRLLAAETRRPTFDALYQSLPNVGGEGSQPNVGIMENRFDIQGLSGYVKTKDGDLLAYSLLLNGYSKASLSKLVEKFAEELAKE
ncbi:D-alanyl-D-alanine carboxypeptidase/D-alanyl-D-alanine endopeptidase [Falsibacillus albus]|uniref:D-alanyl-D-alanine carboxypeptidase/D-alanyl-D-alanine-endopeptidase n=1 Tax=Falsibacillus albus TaxID=2478915 RepID=A0A3L7JUZ6_9BACI|nr:D-alanyl-D-alanine carboxypeptidase/D-alanyl-D-alanine-endopeptidase [Falsibacillus albus]RLQ94064.1 D-alanyl-D-alanine carboxypeptidase/D-alanyl-D-alanine-endopeptidase [Falsibacillus albus]